MKTRCGVVFVLLVSWLLGLNPLTAGKALADGPPTGAFSPVSVPIPTLSTRTSYTYAQDGHYSTTMSLGSLNYLDPSGSWQPIDDTLVGSGASGYAWQNRANNYTAYLPSDLAASLVKFATPSGWVGFSLQGWTGAGPGVAGGDTATYNGSISYNPTPQMCCGVQYTGIQATYTAQNDALKETLTIPGPQVPPSFNYTIQTSANVSVNRDPCPGGPVAFVDANGNDQFEFAPPSMCDASGACSDSLAYQVVLTPAGYGIDLVPDQTWLTSPSRQYPVTIDPTVRMPWVKNRYIFSASGSASASLLYAGVNSGNGAAYHSLMQFDLSSIPAKSQVLSAQLGLYLLTGKTSPLATYQVTRSWTTGATWTKYDGTNAWATAGGDIASSAASPTVTAGTSGGSTKGWYDWYPTQLVQGWDNGTILNTGLMVREPADNVATTLPPQFASPSYTVSSDRPLLTVTYQPWVGDQSFYTLDSQNLTDSLGLGVNVTNGNLFVHQSDLNMPSATLPLTVDRYYNNQATTVAEFGNRWLMSTGPDVGLLRQPDGSVAL
jgi:hypothetical protein